MGKSHLAKKIRRLFSSTYICPRCSLRSSLPTEPTLRASGESAQRSGTTAGPPRSLSNVQRRRFTSVTQRSAVEGAALKLGSTEPFPLDLLTQSDQVVREQHSPNSNIRDQLRQWSEQNQKNKEAGISTTQPSSRSQPVLPTTLYAADEDLITEDDERLDENAEFEEFLEGENRTWLEPGDLVRLPNAKTKGLGIFFGSVGHQNQYLTQKGRWATKTISRTHSEAVVMRQFVNPAELEPLRPFLPKTDMSTLAEMGVQTHTDSEGEMPANLTRPFLHRFAQLFEEFTEFKRAHIGALDLIWDKISLEEEYNFMDIEQLTAHVLGKKYSELTKGGKLCMFNGILKYPSRILVNMDAKKNRVSYIAIPRKAHRDHQQVIEWARQFQECAAGAAMGKNVIEALRQNPLNAFIDKARRLILLSRKTRSPTTIGILGPSSGTEKGEGVRLSETSESFSGSDIMIIEFLWATYLRRPLLPPATTAKELSVGSLILRAIGAYPRQKLEDRIARLLLQEMGALAPWAELSDESLIYQIPGRRGAHVVDELTQRSEVSAHDLGFAAVTAEQGPTKMTDHMADLREDFELLALAADPGTSAVVDDAFSLEVVEGHPTEHWIHIHVAHPSAYISQDDVFAQRARLYGFTVYSSQVPYPMFPWGVAKSMSLDTNRRALTLSVRISQDGSVRQVKMRPTVLKNLERVDSEALKKVMSQTQREKAIFVIGHDARLGKQPEIQQEDIDKVSEHLPMLQKLQELVIARVGARRREVPEYLMNENNRLQSRHSVSYTEAFDINRIHKSYHYHGDPTIRIEADRYMLRASAGYIEEQDDLVSNIMKLCAENAALWFKERGLPGLFAGSKTDPAYPLRRLNNLKEGERALLPIGLMSPSPVPHVNLNFMQFMRISSPLRRWGDLLNTWQIDAFLRAEAEGRVRPDTRVDELGLPFNAEQIEREIENLWPKLGKEFLGNLSIRHWTFQALFRAFHFKEARLPKLWDCRLDKLEEKRAKDQQDTQLRGTFLPLGMPCLFERSKEQWEKQAKWKQFIPCEIVLVDLPGHKVRVRAVGPPSDTETQIYPIHVSSQNMDSDSDATSAAVQNKKGVEHKAI